MKIILVLVLMLITVFVFSDEEFEILSFAYQMELGWLPVNNWVLHRTIYTGMGKDFYLTMDAEIILLNTVFIGGAVRTFMSFTNGDNINFSPSEMWYEFKAGLRFGGFEIGFRRQCMHPMIPYIYRTGIGNINAEGAYEEIYISFKGKIKLF